jgi:hypothetical protein
MKDDKGAVFEFGGPCPKVGSWFFPTQSKDGPKRIEEGEHDDPAQPLGGGQAGTDSQSGE